MGRVITGIGVISPAGLGKEVFWESLLRTEKSTGVSENRVSYIGEFDERAYIDSKTIKYLQRAEKLSLISSHLALCDAGINARSMEGMRAGVATGSTAGCLRALAAFDRQVLCGEASYIDPSLVPSGILSSLTGNVSIRNRMSGFHVPVAAGAASSLQAIHVALTWMKSGRIDAALAGGVEEITHELYLSLLAKEKISGATVSQFAEAAAVVVLESHEQSAERKAEPYAECAGMGFAYSPEGVRDKNNSAAAAARAISDACIAAGVRPEEIDLVWAGNHGGVIGNEIEFSAMKLVLGNRRRPLPIASLGAESLGASGALQVVASALSIKRSMIPPATVCDFTNAEFFYDSPRQANIERVLVSSFSAEGNMGCLILKRAQR